MEGDREPYPTDPARPVPEAEACLRSFRECFNAGRFYEAHDVLEVLWLPVRRTPEGEIWKGLIQLAAAFVHVQHGRRGPALALLRTARARLRQADAPHPRVDLPAAIALAENWEARIDGVAEGGLELLLAQGSPRLDPPNR
jgi:hypothetical protein